MDPVFASISMLNNGWGLVKYLFPRQNKSQIIDPLSTIIRLAIISYKPVGTKISISDNRLYIQDISLLQGTERTLKGDQKEDLLNMYIHIENACKLYLKGDEKIVWFFSKAKEGLIILKQTYKDFPVIIRCLVSYIKIIEKYINNENASEIHDSTYIDNSTVLDEMDIRKKIYEKLGKMWTTRKITIVYEILQEIDSASLKNQKYEMEQIFNALDEFLKIMDKKTNDIATHVV